jgi:hypothetical protein
MKLTKEQKEELTSHGFTSIVSTTDKNVNSAWLAFTKKDGKIYEEICDSLGLNKGASRIDLMVMGCKEIFSEDEIQDYE